MKLDSHDRLQCSTNAAPGRIPLKDVKNVKIFSRRQKTLSRCGGDQQTTSCDGSRTSRKDGCRSGDLTCLNSESRLEDKGIQLDKRQGQSATGVATSSK